MDIYESVFKEGVIITLEFYIEEKELRVIYNSRDVSIKKFFKFSDSKKIFLQILEGIKNQYSKEFTQLRKRSKKWEEIVIKFINNHLNILDSRLDVIIRDNNEIKFVLER